MKDHFRWVLLGIPSPQVRIEVLLLEWIDPGHTKISLMRRKSATMLTLELPT